MKRLRIINSKNNNQTQAKFLSDEWFILNFLREWTPDDITLAITNNIDLAKLLMENTDNDIVNSITGITGKYNVASNESINLTNVLQWFSENRPDLYGAIMNHKDGIKWLKENLNRLKKIL